MCDARDKPVVWLHGEVKRPPFTRAGQIEAGVLLRRLQEGEFIPFPASRPMPSVGKGCHELRVRDAEHNWRIVYFVDPDAVVVLDVFPKKSRQTPRTVIDICQRRLATYLAAERKAAAARSQARKGERDGNG